MPIVGTTVKQLTSTVRALTSELTANVHSEVMQSSHSGVSEVDSADLKMQGSAGNAAVLKASLFTPVT